MIKYTLFLLLGVQFAFSQEVTKTSTYKYGHNGMELVVTNSTSTVIVSTFNSKMAIKDEIAEKVYQNFKENNTQTGDTIIINGANAKVTGKYYIKQKGKLTAVEFYYEKVEWDSGLTEIYKKVG